MARLHVDENLAGQFTADLREKGHDVIFAGDVGKGRTDAWQFREAVSTGRILITLDSDYGYFHRLWTTLVVMGIIDQPHAGILGASEIRGFSQALDLILAAPEELRGRMWRWNPATAWHEDKWRPED